MKAVIAIDSFKGSMTSLEAGRAAKEGIERVFPDAKIYVRPLADGGEGTVEALACGMGGKVYTVRVTGPLGAFVDCQYGVVEDRKLGIIEMSGAAGITLISPDERNPMYTTTYGVGEVICHAMERGCRRFLIGIGGSVTNDGGLGMLQALGYRFLCSDGTEAPRGARGLKDIVEIRDDHVLPELKACSFKIACDVNNPLCGPLGASAVFGPQKGASPEQVREMDMWLEHFACVTQSWNKDADPKFPGTGAAGGLGFAFLAYTNAVLESGVQMVLEETQLETYIKNADIVITGEGQLDGQTAMGKAPIGVARLAKKHGKKVLAFSGGVAKDARVCNAAGIDAFFPILRRVVTLEEAMDTKNAMENMRDAVEQAVRLLRTVACSFLSGGPLP